MAYKALYRTWRPQNFEGLIGQEHVSITLKNAILSGRISHAYLFTGPRGTGKTSTAKVLAKALNCETGPTATPCNHCRSCDLVNDGSAMDVYEIDAASNRGIDEIRELRENVKFSPAQSRYKIYIIDEVHMLTNEAFNALLKTLEEPPAHVVFVLATTEPHRIPATILSRCQRYDFRRVGLDELSDHLAHIASDSGIAATPEALRLIALQSDGGVRDAVSILDQCSVLGNDGITEKEVRELLGLIGQETVYSLFAAVAEGDGAKSLTVLEEQMVLGKDARQLLIELAGYCRSLMLFRAAPNLDSPVLAAFSQERLATDSRKMGHAQLVRLVELFYEAANNARWSVDPRITAEMGLLTACAREEAFATVMVSETVREAKPGPSSRSPAASVQAQPVVAPAVSRPSQSISPPFVPEPAPRRSGVRLELNENDLDRAMDDLLKKVEQAGKRSVKELLKDAKFAGHADGVLTLLFQRETIRERVEKDDIRKWLEELLTQALGASVRLHCTTKLPRPKDPVSSPKPEPAQEAIPAEVLRIQQMFGGKITKIEEDER
ncbi:MAG: DNA polymerase III subunit gamma/tau [Negativicutes bacterium]